MLLTRVDIAVLPIALFQDFIIYSPKRLINYVLVLTFLLHVAQIQRIFRFIFDN